MIQGYLKYSWGDILKRLASRKFIALAIQCFVLVFLPLVYKHYQISDEILKLVLITTSTLVASYAGLNVLQKRWSPFVGGK
jgi:hypothetical protein